MCARGTAHNNVYPIGLDMCNALHPAVEDAFKKFRLTQPIGWIARYGPRSKGSYLQTTRSSALWNRTILSSDEVDFIFQKLNLSILPVQFAPDKSERLSFRHGRKIGSNFVLWAKRMNIPPTVHLWCDLEGKATRPPVKRKRAALCMEYVSGWAYEVKKAGYNVGLYLSIRREVGLKSVHLQKLVNGYYLRKQVSSGSRLSQMQSIKPLVSSFWNAAVNVILKPPGGYSIQQHFQVNRAWYCHYYWHKQQRKMKMKCYYDRKDVDWKLVPKVKGKKSVKAIKFAYDPDNIIPSKNGSPYLWSH